VVQGHAAALVVTDLITDRPNPYAKMFDARRWDVTHSILNAAAIQAHVAKHFVGDRLKHRKGIDIEDLALGCGGICKDHGSVVAAYRDESGTHPRPIPKSKRGPAHIHSNVPQRRARA